MLAPCPRVVRCLVCGSRRLDLVANYEELRSEFESLWAYHTNRVRPDTPASRLIDRLVFSEPPPFRVLRCRACGLVFRSPTEADADLVDTYRQAEPSTHALSSLHDAQRPAARAQARRLRALFGEEIVGLEVGSYTGAFLGAARDEGMRFRGLDVCPVVNRFARSLGYAVDDGDFSAYSARRMFDVVAIWNTFDQLADPAAAVRTARRVLRPRGVLALRVPNGDAYVRWHRASTRGPRVWRPFARAAMAQNNLLSFPYRFGFTPDSLARLVRSAGFCIERVLGDVLPPLADRWTRLWARAEEIVVKRPASTILRRLPAVARWFELYARRVG